MNKLMDSIYSVVDQNHQRLYDQEKQQVSNYCGFCRIEYIHWPNFKQHIAECHQNVIPEESYKNGKPLILQYKDYKKNASNKYKGLNYCGECNKEYAKFDKLQLHIATCHNRITPRNLYKNGILVPEGTITNIKLAKYMDNRCGSCTNTFFFIKARLHDHIREKHNGICPEGTLCQGVIVPANQQLKKCKYKYQRNTCCQKSASKDQQLIIQNCFICQQSFKNIDDLNDHMVESHNCELPDKQIFNLEQALLNNNEEEPQAQPKIQETLISKSMLKLEQSSQASSASETKSEIKRCRKNRMRQLRRRQQKKVAENNISQDILSKQKPTSQSYDLLKQAIMPSFNFDQEANDALFQLDEQDNTKEIQCYYCQTKFLKHSAQQLFCHIGIEHLSLTQLQTQISYLSTNVKLLLDSNFTKLHQVKQEIIHQQNNPQDARKTFKKKKKDKKLRGNNFHRNEQSINQYFNQNIQSQVIQQSVSEHNDISYIKIIE